jgi:hypothetical protein
LNPDNNKKWNPINNPKRDKEIRITKYELTASERVIGVYKSIIDSKDEELERLRIT